MRTRRLWMLAVSLLFLAADAMAQGTQWQGSAQIATNGTAFTIPRNIFTDCRCCPRAESAIAFGMSFNDSIAGGNW